MPLIATLTDNTMRINDRITLLLLPDHGLVSVVIDGGLICVSLPIHVLESAILDLVMGDDHG